MELHAGDKVICTAINNAVLKTMGEYEIEKIDRGYIKLKGIKRLFVPDIFKKC